MNKLFTTIKVKEEHIEAISVISKLIEEDNILLDAVGVRMKKHKEMLFESIDELYPDLSYYDYSYNHEKHTMRIIGIKSIPSGTGTSDLE